MRQLRQETIDFVERAPKKLRFEARVGAAPEAVFDALAAEASTWLEWFPGLTAGHSEGNRREISIGRTTYRETILVSERPTRWAFRVDETNAPVARALIEEWCVAPDGDGSRVSWNFCVDPTPVFRVALPVAPIVMGRLFRRAMKNLALRLDAQVGGGEQGR